MRGNNYILTKFFLLTAILMCACQNNIQYNIYEEYKPGSVLDINALKRSERIIKDDGYILLVINNSKDEYYDPHILFYNPDKKLCCATYLPGKISSIKKNVINFYLNSERDSRKKYYVNDLPPNFKMKPDLTKPTSGYGLMNKVVYKLNFNNSDNKINCSFKVFDKFIEYDLLSEESLEDDEFVIDSLTIDVGELKIEPIDKGRIMFSKTVVNQDKYMVDFYVLNDSLANVFYTQISKSYINGIN